MGQPMEIMVQRLRRFARALCHDCECGDALVLDALAAAEDKRTDFNRLLTFIIARRRDQEEVNAQLKTPRTGPHACVPPRPDILRAFEHLSLPDREVIALISVEGLSYEDAASVLALRDDAFIARLTRARSAFGREVDGARHVVLRLVK